LFVSENIFGEIFLRSARDFLIVQVSFGKEPYFWCSLLQKRERPEKLGSLPIIVIPSCDIHQFMYTPGMGFLWCACVRACVCVCGYVCVCVCVCVSLSLSLSRSLYLSVSLSLSLFLSLSVCLFLSLSLSFSLSGWMYVFLSLHHVQIIERGSAKSQVCIHSDAHSLRAGGFCRPCH